MEWNEVLMTTSESRQKQWILVLAFACFVAIGINSGLLGVAWPSIRAEFGLALDAVAALFIAGTIGFVLGSVFAGQLVSRLGLLGFLAVGNFVAAAGFTAAAAAPAWAVIVISGLLTGFGSAAIDTGANIYVAGNHSVRTMNWMHASFGLGATLGPIVVTTALALALGWRYAYGLVAVVHLLLGILILIRSRSIRLDSGAAHGSGSDGIMDRSRLSETLRMPMVWLGILLFLIYAGLEVTTGQWTFTLFTESRGVSTNAAGILTSVFWGMLTIGRIVLGAGAQRIGIERLLRVSMIGAIAAAILIMFRNVPLGFLGVGLMGLTLSAIFPTLTSDTPNRVGLSHAATAIGYQTGAASVGIAILPSVAGALAERISLEAIGPFLLVCAILMFVVNELAIALIRRNPTMQ